MNFSKTWYPAFKMCTYNNIFEKCFNIEKLWTNHDPKNGILFDVARARTDYPSDKEV